MEVIYAEPGTEVILGRHTQDNRYAGLEWVYEMERFVGRKTKITALKRGRIPSCYVECDGGEFYWRIGDMILASDVPLLTPEERVRRKITDG